jgi:excinuclease ABC subunit A
MLPLKLVGARTHNLKGIDLSLEPGQVVALTGVSGAGKSSLALDTLYAEGQRRFVESFSPYARQFLERLPRPPLEKLEPVPAAVAVDRAAPVKSSRSTVATMTDLEPLLAGLFLRESTPVCPEHGQPAVARDVASVSRELLQLHPGERAVLTYRIPLSGTEQYLEVRDGLLREGHRRLWVDGMRDIDEVKPSELGGRVDVVVDRFRIPDESGRPGHGSNGADARVAQGLEAAWRAGKGSAALHLVDTQAVLEVREGLSCPTCARELPPAVPGLFSYDSPLGACQRCRGFGRIIGIDLGKVIPDPSKTLGQRAVRPWSGPSTAWERRELGKLCARHGIPLDVSWKELSEKQRAVVLQGDGDWEVGLFPGVLGWFRWLETRTYKMHVRVLLSRYRSYDPCPECNGERLNPVALSYHLLGESIGQWHHLEIDELLEKLSKLETKTGQGNLLQLELQSRLDYLSAVGLGYLTLDRQARTLSGGEAQRVTLTAALGTSLHHALFVLDEPSVGLHPADVEKLNVAVRKLAERNNIVLLVEHDGQMIREADRVVELGPGAGVQGGEIEFDGTVEQAIARGGATARALDGMLREQRRVRKPQQKLKVLGARANNLRGVDVEIPLHCIVAVTGPSGSGKTTLIEDVLYPALARRFKVKDAERPLEHDHIEGAGLLSHVAFVDQSPLGRTSRGNAATYTKAWDAIRKVFADVPTARQAGIPAAHFSFNVPGGRCDTCSGEGYETVEMQFLADVHLECPMCRGRRFKESILRITYQSSSVADVLSGSVDQALELFASKPAIIRALGPLKRLGLGYLKLGQPLSTLSGGEAQRLKLARTLSEKIDGTLFFVDEPSAGLHADEVALVIECLNTIVDAGGSVVVVDHDLGIIRAADWIIDMGPGSGKHGGLVVAEGPPAELRLRDTATGRALRDDRGPKGKSGPREKAASALHIKNAREHNLRDVSVDIPHGVLTVVTGPSGSGKSSLVFDVMFAEGQRRFLETLSPYARRFLPRMPKPNVDQVSGVPPSIALEQRTARAGANSTVATVTEVAHYLRLLFAKLGVPHCPHHGEPIGARDPFELFANVRELKGHWRLLAPVVEARKGTYLDVFNDASRAGIEFALCDGQIVRTDLPPVLVKSREHDIDVVLFEGAVRALTESTWKRALDWGKGTVRLAPLLPKTGEPQRYSTLSACPECGFSVPELDPRWFSFNTAQGRCPDCEGQGVKESLKKRKGETIVTTIPCTTCEGSRLAPVPRAVKLHGQGYHELTQCSVAEFQKRIEAWAFAPKQRSVAEPIQRELSRRVDFLVEVGLDYLSLDRAARTLSGGEMQRLRLAAQLGAGLTGALYVLDEPTVGLHPRDTGRLMQNLKKLVALGSTVVVVEHDADTIAAADHLIDMGPGGGGRGGRVMAVGTPSEVLQDPSSPTAQSFARKPKRRPVLEIPKDHPHVALSGVSANNLRNVDAAFPVARLTVVAGVSGSGKSTLVRGVLLPAVRRKLGLVTGDPLAFDKLVVKGVARAISVDQSPIGRTPRSVPATFLGIWDAMRKLFASSTEAKMAGFSATRFSFNSAQGGRCKTCEGQGVITHEMSFLPDVVQDCPACGGLRFEEETLRVRYLGRNIGEMLNLTVEEAVGIFEHHREIRRPLETLVDLGAGYIHLGQGSHTLSGGEAQRLKLASELTASARHEPTLYVLDEPTTGLHQGDVEKLMSVLSRLVDRGDTLVVIEHHPWVIAGADHVIELGPEGGARGGKVVASCTPSKLAKKNTATGRILEAWLEQG